MNCACSAAQFCKSHIMPHLKRRGFGRMVSGDLLFGWPDDILCVYCDEPLTVDSVMTHLREAHDVKSEVRS